MIEMGIGIVVPNCIMTFMLVCFTILVYNKWGDLAPIHNVGVCTF